MKELLIFRIFAMFPFIGTILPDVANAFRSTFSSIPKDHIIIDITLSVCIIICSAKIWTLEDDPSGPSFQL